MQRAHAERAVIEDSRATLKPPHCSVLLSSRPRSPTGCAAQRLSLVTAAVDEGGVGHVAGSGALRLIQMVRGEDEFDSGTSLETIAAATCIEAVSAALSRLDAHALLPQPSPAVHELLQKFGSLYVFYKGFAYRALSDGWSPHEEGKCTLEGQSLPLPPAHEIAPDDQHSMEVSLRLLVARDAARYNRDQVIAQHPWCTRVMVVNSGVGYFTGTSAVGEKFGPRSDRRGRLPSYLIEVDAEDGSGTHYSVSTSSLGILIRTPLHRWVA